MSATIAEGRGTVVVAGGGLAGTLAASVLREFADQVVVVERDRYPAEPGWRRGTPQSNHAHLLLEAGHRGLEELLPGIRAQLLDAGAVSVVVGSELRWRNAVGWMAPHESPLAFLSLTRSLLDHIVRSRVLSDPKVHVVEGTKVVGFLGDARAVTGVRTRELGRTATIDVPADLVVDASGRDSAAARWLAELGCPPAPTTEVDAGCAYISRLIHLDRRMVSGLGFGALYVQTSPGQPWMGSMLPVENDQFIVSLGGMHSAQPGQGEAGFEAILNRLPDPIMRDIVHQADSATNVEWLQAGPSIRRDVRQDPDGLIRIGDAGPNKLNPVYGQGMTCAVLAVLALRDAVAQHNGITPAAQNAARCGAMVATHPAWLMSSSEDARLPETVGAPRGPLIRAQHMLFDGISLRATKKPRVSAAVASVMAMVEPPTALMRPSVVAALLGIG
ncbi:FAD-dependent monooxygenase [Nocardia sp. NPDC049220]|uniref:FAD-dependent oxidoreductase n=1 Tax=Nocardia sp. NPDC049220 TaxID=3155273 RepID=UPI0033CB804C